MPATPLSERKLCSQLVCNARGFEHPARCTQTEVRHAKLRHPVLLSVALAVLPGAFASADILSADSASVPDRAASSLPPAATRKPVTIRAIDPDEQRIRALSKRPFVVVDQEERDKLREGFRRLRTPAHEAQKRDRYATRQ